jgi:hypothetical protein
LERVTERKYQEQRLIGKTLAAQFWIAQVEDVFTIVTELFASF